MVERTWAGLGMALRSWSTPLARRLQQPTYRLRDYQEVAQAARLGFRLDVNQATVDDWLRLPGLSIHQARALDQLRQGGVPLLCIDDVAAALDLPSARLAPLAPVLDFRYYAPAPPPLSLNRATLAQLRQVLSPALAAAIVGERYHRGAFRSWADLQQRLALAPDTVHQLIHQLRL